METLSTISPPVNAFPDEPLFTSLGSHLLIGNKSPTSWYVQAHPARYCRCVGAAGKTGCDDRRCSLECHLRLAKKERHILTRCLESLPADFRLYATTLNSPLPVDLGDFLKIYRAFQKGIRKRFGKSVQYRPEVEVGPDSRKPHVHLAMWSTGVEVTKADILAIWREAWGGHEGRMNVDHRPMDDVGTWSRYMLKAGWEWHDPGNPAECVRLFKRGTPRLPQATGGFYRGKTKAALWAECKAGWARARHPASEPVGDASPIRSEDDSVGVETQSGIVLPHNEHAEKSRFSPGKHRGKSILKRFYRSRLCVRQLRSAGRHSPFLPQSQNGRSGFGGDRKSRPVSHRQAWEARSIRRMPGRRLVGPLGPLARPP